MASWCDLEHLGWSAAAAATTALLVWLGSGLHPLWPLMWLAPLPVLLVATRASGRLTAIVAFVAWFLGGCNLWRYLRGSLGMPGAAVLSILVPMALAFVGDVLLFRALVRRQACWSAVFAFPAGWVAFEYVVSLSTSGGTVGSLAYSQLAFLPILQSASLAGPWGISFLLFLFPAAVAVGAHLYGTAPKRATRVLGVALAVIAAALAFGWARLAAPEGGARVKAGLLASDAHGHANVQGEGAPTLRLLQSYADRAAQLGAEGVKVVVLPEKIGIVGPADLRGADATLQSVADRTGVTIVAGLIHKTARADYNEARVYAPNRPVLTYHKEHLLPHFESRLTPGTALTVVPRPSGKWGVAICKDMDFTGLSRRYGKAGAGLLLVPGWDFTVDWVYHGHIALMRGVEDGCSVVRAAKDGSLYASDNRGRILAEVRSDSAPFAELVSEVPAAHAKTVYLVLGNSFAWLAMALTLGALLRLLRPWDRSRWERAEAAGKAPGA